MRVRESESTRARRVGKTAHRTCKSDQRQTPGEDFGRKATRKCSPKTGPKLHEGSGIGNDKGEKRVAGLVPGKVLARAVTAPLRRPPEQAARCPPAEKGSRERISERATTTEKFPSGCPVNGDGSERSEPMTPEHVSNPVEPCNPDPALPERNTRERAVGPSSILWRGKLRASGNE